jgi:predicted small secreted protein
MNKEFKALYLGTIVGMLAGSMVTSIILHKEEKPIQNKGIEFVWNDDEESIPVDGSLIRLEFTDEDTVYIGPR